MLHIWRKVITSYTLTEDQHFKAEKGENMLKLFQQAAGMEIRITDGELHPVMVYNFFSLLFTQLVV